MTPNARQASFLFRLVIEGNSPKRSEMKPAGMTKAEKDALVSAGLVSEMKKGNSRYIEANDRTWQWTSANLGVEIAKTHDLAPVVQRLLGLLGEFLRREARPLADILAPRSIEPPADLREQIRRLYLELSGGQTERPVRLAQIKNGLANLSGAEIDGELLKMLRSGEANLQSIAYYPDITAEDRVHAAYVDGIPRHVLYLMK